MKCTKCQTENRPDSKYCRECATSLTDADRTQPAFTRTLELPADSFKRGTLFAGRYEIIEELGKGGMGAVYRVEDTKAREEIAIKLINPDISAEHKTIERFRNELLTARKIRHKNICGMYELNESGGIHFITMEYVPGEDLKSFLRRSRQLSIRTAVQIGQQICEGLSEAHRMGVVHRDLKPANIMIDKDGNTRIMDFGIARTVKSKGITGEGLMIGTPEYMSPEQAEAKDVDQRSDLYSLGAILYEMVAGRLPFEGDTPLAVAMKHKTDDPSDPKQFNAQIPDDLSGLILKCLAKDKEHRYETADELRSDLENIETGMPTTEVTAPRRKPLTSKEITLQFNPRKLFAPVSIGAALILVVLLAIWRPWSKPRAVAAPIIENSIAVISFENQTGDEAYDYLQKAIPNLLITSLEQDGHFHVATWERLRDLLKQIGKDDAEFIDSDTGFAVCHGEGIEAIVIGSFVKAGDVFATDVKVYDVETKRMIKSASSQGRQVDSILERQIGELSREISHSLGIQAQTAERSSTNLADITSTSMEAFDLFLRGEEAFNKNYFEEARVLFEQAVSLDPNFAMAWARLSNVSGTLNDYKTRDQAIEKAMMLSERASDKEKQRIEIDYASTIEQDFDKYLSLLLQFVGEYPKEKWAHSRLGMYYKNRKLDLTKALDEFHKVLALDPEYGQALNMSAYSYLDLKEYQKAIEYFQRYAAVSPGEANPYDSLGNAFFMAGKIEEAILNYHRALQIKPDFLYSMKGLVYIYALKQDYPEAMRILEEWMDLAQSPRDKREALFCRGFYHFWFGHLDKCLLSLEKSQELAREVGFELGIYQADYLKAWMYYDWDDLELSREFIEKWLDSALRSLPQNPAFLNAMHNLFLGLIELKEGRINLAKKRLIDLEALIPDMTERQKENFASRFELLQAEVFLAEGDADKCIEIMEKQTPRIPGYLERAATIITYNMPFRADVLPRAYLFKGDLDSAISAYEDLIVFDPVGPERYLINPIYYYRLAKVYEVKGWKGKALESYEKFLDLWKDADPALPEVVDAIERVAELR